MKPIKFKALPVRAADINTNDNNIDLEKILVVLFAIVY